MLVLDVEVHDFLGVRLDELLARRHRRAHQHVEGLVRLDAVVDRDLQQRARAGSIVVSQSCSGFISPRPL